MNQKNVWAEDGATAWPGMDTSSSSARGLEPALL